jgi:hypothetical protein
MTFSCSADKSINVDHYFSLLLRRKSQTWRQHAAPITALQSAFLNYKYNKQHPAMKIKEAN